MDVLLNTMNQQINIPLQNLYPSPDNSFEPDDIPELAANIKACGLVSPLSVIGPDADGNYEIISGERRYRALSMIMEEDPDFMSAIPCYVIGSADMESRHKRLAIEFSNMETRDNVNKEAHRFTIMQLLKDLCDTGEMQERKIATMLANVMHTSKRYGRMYASIFREGTPDLQRAVMSHEKDPNENGTSVHIPTSIASRVARLEPDLQAAVIERVNMGEKPNDALNAVLFKNNLIAQDSLDDDDMDEPAFDVDDDEDVGSTDSDASDGDKKMFSEMERALRNGEDFDLDGYDDPMEVFRRNSDSVDLNLDTAGRLKTIRNSDKGDSKVADERRVITGWIDRMTRALDHGYTLDEADATIIEDLATLVEKYNTSIAS